MHMFTNTSAQTTAGTVELKQRGEIIDYLHDGVWGRGAAGLVGQVQGLGSYFMSQSLTQCHGMSQPVGVVCIGEENTSQRES